MKAIPRSDVPGTWVVVSGPSTYHVDLRDPFTPSCDCPSHIWRDQMCKHVREAQKERDAE